MSIFDRLDRLTSRAVDGTFATSFWILPLSRNANGRPAPDTEREEISGKGIFDEEPELSALEIGNRDRTGNDFRSLVAGQSYQLSVDRTRYPAIDQVKQGDRVSLDDARVFHVTETRRDGMSRVVLVLSSS